MGESGHCREPVPGVRTEGTRVSIWRVNPDQARLASRGSCVPGVPRPGAGAPTARNSLPWGASGPWPLALPFPGVSLVLYEAEGHREGGNWDSRVGLRKAFQG